MNIYFFTLFFFFYGFLGWCTEVAYAAVKQRKFINRGFLNGPICPIYGIGVGLVVLFLIPLQEHVLVLYLASTLLVTVIEGVTGFLMDKMFHHKWWDYSGQPFHIGSYVCLPFSLIWGVACVLIVRLIHPLIFHVLSLLPQMFGNIIIIVLTGILVVDIYVTAAGILKLNRRLESMERIALELKELSNKVGVNIYENVMETLEKHENLTAEQKELVSELKGKYQDMLKQKAKVVERLMTAFPKMESKRYKDALAQLKRTIHIKDPFK